MFTTFAPQATAELSKFFWPRRAHRRLFVFGWFALVFFVFVGAYYMLKAWAYILSVMAVWAIQLAVWIVQSPVVAYRAARNRPSKPVQEWAEERWSKR